MTEQAPYQSVFYRVATKEDHYTQLLLNLMQRPNGLRKEFLSRFICKDPNISSQVAPSHLSTQVFISDAGRPDLVIDSPSIRAVVEVKLNPRRGCTDYQIPDDDGFRRGYCEFLNRATTTNRVLSFLVPRDWIYVKETREKLARFEQRDPSIRTGIFFWEDVFDLRKNLSEDSILAEFWQLLAKDFQSIEFTKEEIDVMVNRAGLPIRAIGKAAHLVDQIAKKARIELSEYIINGPEHEKSGEQYGLEFYKKKIGHRTEYCFWFGIWSPFWEEHGKALCFGVSHEQQPATQRAFMDVYSGEKREYGVSPQWTLGWIPEADISGSDPVANVWNRLRPVLDKVYAATES